jgi:hypothetical protein
MLAQAVKPETADDDDAVNRDEVKALSVAVEIRSGPVTALRRAQDGVAQGDLPAIKRVSRFDKPETDHRHPAVIRLFGEFAPVNTSKSMLE